MLNHTYTSVKNANLVDCGKKQHIPSQPSPLLKDNFLGEFRTELDKKKVLSNLGIATSLSLEWEYIKGDIGRSEALMKELDSRTTYVSAIDGFQKTLLEGIAYLESVVGGEQAGEEEQNQRLADLETLTDELVIDLEEVKEYLTETVSVNMEQLESSLLEISTKVNDITNLINVSNKPGNALSLLKEGDLAEGETPGLYVPDLSEAVSEASGRLDTIEEDIDNIKDSLDDFVTKDDLGGDGFDFVNQGSFDSFVDTTNDSLSDIREELNKTVKTGEDGHVNTLYVNEISKNNDNGNIKITDSFETEDGIPLDVRFVRENLEELYAIPAKVCYPGMGVIVNSLSALYILRKPAEGVTLNQEYISNPNNWKCPEDLVTVALTKEEYESLDEVNPNVFYYVYEEEIERTQEPKRDDYSTEEEFNNAWKEWTNSLKILSQEYMSASWGVDIENKLGKKASSQSVSQLMAEIKAIKGDGNAPSLESLNTDIEKLKTKSDSHKEKLDEILIRYEDVEQGRLVDVEKEVASVKDNLSNYVTKDYIQDTDNDFIFVEKSDYESDKEVFKQELAEQVESSKVVTDLVSLSGNELKGNTERLTYNESSVANLEDIPDIRILSQAEYDSLSEDELKEDTYYYTFDGDNTYVTKVELERNSAKLQQQINTLFKGGTQEDIESTLEMIFVPVDVWNKFQEDYAKLSVIVKDIQSRLYGLDPLEFTNVDDSINIVGDPARCYIQGDTVYIISDLITII